MFAMATPHVRDLSLYDGRVYIGRIKVAADGNAVAFDRHGKCLGSSPTFKAAYAAFKRTDGSQTPLSITGERASGH